MIFRKGELFSGPGGLSYAAINSKVKNTQGKEFGIKHVWSNDFDKDSCDTFRFNICPENKDSVIHKNVEELEIKKLPPIDCFVFGFPCNDFSEVGKKKGTDGDFGKLYKYGVEVLNYHNPKWFLAENVPGLKSSKNGEDLKKILNELSNAGDFGYVLTPHEYKFEEYGVPQIRKRIIIVGIRKDLNIKFKIPSPTTPVKFMTASEALKNIPIDASNNELPKHTKEVIERLSYIPAGENAWYEGIPEHLRIKTNTKLSQIYKRLDPDKPSYTLTASGGGGTHVYHWKENRALTNRERARIQTFPDNFVFIGEKESVRKQIGMAVPPHGAQIIFEAILKCFAGIEYPFIEK